MSCGLGVPWPYNEQQYFQAHKRQPGPPAEDGQARAGYQLPCISDKNLPLSSPTSSSMRAFRAVSGLAESGFPEEAE
jgi:hypothetical protein